MKLISNWKQFPKLWSVHCLGLVVVIQGVSITYKEELALHIPWWPDHSWLTLLNCISLVLALLGGVLRVVSQQPDESV